MILLLDTHVFLWWATEPAKLPPNIVRMCEDPANRMLLSVASVWEMQIKIQRRRLSLLCPLSEIVEKQCGDNSVRLLPIEFRHVMRLAELPPIHKDPFDRLIIAQALQEGASILSADGVLTRYPVDVFW